MVARNRRYVLDGRPNGVPDDSVFKLTEGPIPTAGTDEVVVRTGYLSVDPYMRGKLRDVDPADRPWAVTFDEAWPLGEPVRGMAVGRVVESNHFAHEPGNVITGRLEWADYTTSNGDDLRPVDRELAPAPAWLGVLGRPGRAAYIGLFEYGEPKPGETVVISAAAGAVGMTAGQLATRVGCRTVGIAGSDEKTAFLTGELGFDAAINYRTRDVQTAIDETCPDGVDVYFDNVGGEITDGVVSRLNHGARVPVSGQTALYNKEETPTGPRHMWRLLVKRARVEGFSILDHEADFDAVNRALGRLLQSGDLTNRQTIAEGLESAPAAFVGLFKGANIGKQLVEVDAGVE